MSLRRGRVRRHPCPPMPLFHRIVHVTVYPQRRLIPIDDSIKVRGERDYPYPRSVEADSRRYSRSLHRQ